MKKFLVAGVLLALILACLLPVQAAEIADSGEYNENVFWELDEDGVLTIFGEGDVEENLPWAGYKDRIKKIVIGVNISHVSDAVFLGCPKLTAIEVGEGNPTYSSENGVLFSKDKTMLYKAPIHLEAYEVPASVTYIRWNAFEGCTKLTQITLPANLEQIGEYAFSGCSGLTAVTFPEKLENIADGAFENCTGLTQIVLPPSTEDLGKDVFSGCKGITAVTLQGNFTNIRKHLFRDCEALTAVVIPEGVTQIGDGAFSGCKLLQRVDLPVSIETISGSAFDGSGLKEVFYAGSAETWKAVKIGENEVLSKANITYAIVETPEEDPEENEEEKEENA